MKLKSIPYKRFWHEMGEEMPLDENGFLRNPESKWYHVYFEKNVYTIEYLAETDCLLLLGEPGIGKSTELEKLILKEQEKEHKRVSFTLRQFESKSDFKDTVLNDNTVLEWIEKSDEPLSLYLDGLDEALLETKKISYGVIDVVKKLKKYGQIFIRLTCRTSDLPKEFQHELLSLFSNSSKVIELAPLRREDVQLAAKEHGLDGKKLFSVIYEKELGALASRPITLNMLIKEYHEYGKISESIEGVYEKGCLFLLEDTKDRKEAGYESKVTQSQRLVIAERIAATLILCNFSNLNTGSIQELSKTELHVDEIDAGEEIIRDTGEKVIVNKQSIDEVVNTSLFKPFGRDRFSLTHQTFAEYLTARYLLRNQFEMSQLESILLHDDGDSKGVIPQLKEVAMWLALMHEDFFMTLIEVDPFLLLKSSIDINDKGKLEQLIRSLIKKVSERNRVPNYFRYFKFLKNLEFDGIHTLLKTEISKSKRGAHAKKVVLDIIDAIKIKALASDLIKLALDPKERLDLRVHTLEVLSELDSDSSDLAKLLPLLEDPNENEYQLVSKAIKCLYPTLIQSKQLIEVFDQSAKLKDEILKSSGYHIIDSSNNKDLVILLNWAGDNFPENNFPSHDSADFFDKIILKGVKKIDESDVKKSLSRYIYKKTQKHYRLFDATLSEKSYSEFLEYPEARRKIVEEIVSIFTNEFEEEFAYKLRRYRHNLVVNEDFDWVLNHVLRAKNKKEGKLWAEILSWSLDLNNVEQIENILLNQENEFIKNSFHFYLTPLEIHSDEGKKAKERHDTIRVPRKEKPKNNVNPDQLISENLNHLRNGKIDKFIELDLALSLNPESQYYDKHLDFDIERYPGWIKLNSKLKKEVIEFAFNFIQEAEPADDEWLNDYYSRTAYRAFRLIDTSQNGSSDNVQDDVWKKWLKPILYFELSDGIGADQRFTKLLFHKFNTEVIDFVCELIKFENEKHNGSIFVIRNVDSILTNELAEALFILLNDEELKPRAKEIIKEKLVEFGHPGVLEFISSGLNKDDDVYVSNAFLLCKYSPSTFFEFVWPEFEKDSELSRNVATKIASTDRHEQEILKDLKEEQLAKLFVWLEKNYPISEDPKMEGAVTTRMMISDLRRYALNHLVSKGTEEACNQLKIVISELPKHKWLRDKYEEAKEVYRRENWQPIEVNQLLLLSQNVKEQDHHIDEIVELRPNFFGLGVNIRALWRKYMANN